MNYFQILWRSRKLSYCLSISVKRHTVVKVEGDTHPGQIFCLGAPRPIEVPADSYVSWAFLVSVHWMSWASVCYGTLLSFLFFSSSIFSLLLAVYWVNLFFQIWKHSHNTKHVFLFPIQNIHIQEHKYKFIWKTGIGY